MHKAAVFFLVGIVSLSFACATTTTTTRTMWTEPVDGEVRDGRVEWVKESVTRTKGDPGVGAVAGAIVGGALGRLITGRRAGAAVGAATGAIIGATESQGSSESRRYDVLVRFDDGAAHVFSYWGAPPFRPGQPVRLTSHGLIGRGEFIAAPAPPPTVSPESESSAEAIAPRSPEPIDTPPPPDASTTAPVAAPPKLSGRWGYTQQYGWVWMPYGSAYTFTSHYQNGDPYMYVYYPRRGWIWVEAPWLWGWGTRPYFGIGTSVRFNWYTQGWGRSWTGPHRSPRYRDRYFRRSRPGVRRRR
jgi:outer membrane lipoprotein SlyB